MEYGTIDLEHDDGVLVVTLVGEPDVENASLLRDALGWWFSSGSTVIVDLSARHVRRHRRAGGPDLGAHEQRPIAVVAPSGGAPRRLFDRLRLGEVLPTYERHAAEALVPASGSPRVP